jgi:hypothetical protein
MGRSLSRPTQGLGSDLRDDPLRCRLGLRLDRRLARWNLYGPAYGEAVAPAKDGTTDFSVLQNELKGKSTKIALVAFDLLYLNGYDLRQLPLIERKAHLKKIINGTDVQFSESFEVDERRCTRTPARSGWKASSPRSATASIIRDAAMIG